MRLSNPGLRTGDRPARRSPILVAGSGVPRALERKKMIRLSVRKLRRLGDPESLLRRAVLINNTLESARAAVPLLPNLTAQQSSYTMEEEQIIAGVRCTDQFPTSSTISPSSTLLPSSTVSTNVCPASSYIYPATSSVSPAASLLGGPDDSLSARLQPPAPITPIPDWTGGQDWPAAQDSPGGPAGQTVGSSEEEWEGSGGAGLEWREQQQSCQYPGLPSWDLYDCNISVA